MDHQEKLVLIGKKYVEEFADPWLVKEGLFDRTMICFSGSVGHGYADQFSDIEIEFYINENLSKDKREDFRSLLQANTDYESVRISPELNTEWKLELILDEDLEKLFWKKFDPYVLFEMTHSKEIWDPLKILDTIKEKINFYPDDIFVKVVRGLWITINDSGFFNAGIAAKRENVSSAYMLLYRSLEAGLRLAYVLNREYYPHTKWLTKGLKNLKNNFNSVQHLEKINQGDINLRYQAIKSYIKEFEDHLATAGILEQEDIDNPWSLLSKPYYIHSTF